MDSVIGWSTSHLGEFSTGNINMLTRYRDSANGPLQLNESPIVGAIWGIRGITMYPHRLAKPKLRVPMSLGSKQG